MKAHLSTSLLEKAFVRVRPSLKAPFSQFPGVSPSIQFVSITLEFLVAHDIIDLRWLQSGWP